MKNTILIAAGLFTAAVAGAQTTTTATQPAPQTPAADTTTLTNVSVNSAYIADPEALKGLTTETLRPEHAFPVLGTYTATGSSTKSVTINLDPENKGKIWVEGLPQGKFKALLMKAPATYKIPAQQTENGKTISEGTLFLNPTTRELTIVLGRPFTADPTALAAKGTSQKSKAWQYTGTKAAAATTPAPVSQQ